MTDQKKYLEQGLDKAREASRTLARFKDEEIRAVLETLAERTMAAEQQILEANQSDLSRMPQSDPKYDRLLLNHQRLADIAMTCALLLHYHHPLVRCLRKDSWITVLNSAKYGCRWV